MKIVGPPWGDLDQCRLAGFEHDDVYHDDVYHDDDNDNENMLDRPLYLNFSLLGGCENISKLFMTRCLPGRFDTHIDYAYLSNPAQETWQCKEVCWSNL